MTRVRDQDLLLMCRYVVRYKYYAPKYVNFLHYKIDAVIAVPPVSLRDHRVSIGQDQRLMRVQPELSYSVLAEFVKTIMSGTKCDLPVSCHNSWVQL